MKSRIAVIGMGIFGREVAFSLSQRGFPVLVIDRDADMVEPVKDHVARAMVLDTTMEAALLEAKIDEMSVVVNAIGMQHIENSILTTALLYELRVPRIVARATNKLHERILLQVGATEVVNPERDMGCKVAHQVARPGLREVLPLAEGVCVAEVPVPQSFVGKNLAELGVRRNYGVNVVAVQRVRLAQDLDAGPSSQGDGPDDGVERLLDMNRRMILNVDPQKDRFLKDDAMVVIGREDDVNRLTGLA